MNEELSINHWSKVENEKSIRSWKRRLLVKRILWRITFGLAERSKRLLDIVGSFFALIAFFPIFFVTAAAILIEDKGPVFFKQKRVGCGGHIFYIWKFRSMVKNADQVKQEILHLNQHDEGVTFKSKKDPRITRVGAIIRKLSIDELPQFWNVFIGDMALVGPRPPVPSEVARYKAAQLRRLMVKPGITCLWQVGGRSDIDFEGQVRLDLQYIRSENLLQDIKILFLTVPAVLLGKGAY